MGAGGPSLDRLSVPGGRAHAAADPPAVICTSPQARWTHGCWQAAKGSPDMDCGGRRSAATRASLKFKFVQQAVASERRAGWAP